MLAGAVSVVAVVGIVAVVGGSLAASVRESKGSKEGPDNEPRGTPKAVRCYRVTRWLPFLLLRRSIRSVFHRWSMWDK